MKIYDATDQLLLDINVDDTSYRYRAIGGDHNLVLKYSLTEHIELPVGAYAVYDGKRYALKRPQDFKMQHSRRFDYTVTLESPQADSKIWKFRNPVDGRLKFSLTAKPHEHLQMFVDNMNRRDTGWTVGDCIEGTEKLINYDHDYCWGALGKMASEFNTEFEIADKRVSLRKVEYNKSNPLPLSYGMGNGFKSGVGRANSGDKPPIEILYVQGGSENIDPSTYGSRELKLPVGQTIAFDGEHFEDEEGFQAAAARHYVVDDLGLSIRRSDKPVSTLAEDSLDASEVYPKRVGKVSKVVTVNKDGNLYDFIDETIPAELNFEDCLIEGETMTVIFQTGMLAGREFEVNYFHNPKKDKLGRRFELVPQEIDGETMPNEVFKPTEKDTYAVFKCALPPAYIRNDTTKTGASWDMFREAVKYLYDNEEAKYTFTGTLDGLWAKKDWLNIGGRLILGGFVLFRSKEFLPQGVLVRITGIKDFINNPHSPTIELSNETKSESFGTDMAKLEATEVHVDDNYRSAVQFTKRRFRDARETITMLESALLDNFTNSINPIAVQTMSMLVGDESLQFRFVDNEEDPHTVPHSITYDNSTHQLTADAGLMQHLTLGIDSLSSSHKAEEYRFWGVSAYTSASLVDTPNTAYYLYIKASRDNNAAEFYLSATPKKMEADPNVYYFLAGVLNKEYDGERSFVTLYGFTEILPGRVTTDRVVSGDGDSYFDMVANAMKLGDALDFNSNGDRKLRIKGTIVQSPSGDESYVGCYRGVYDPVATYFNGDEVTYTDNGLTSLYRFISDTPKSGIAPTNTLYWQIIARGSKGEDGKDGQDGISPNTAYKSTVFTRSNTTPATPTGGSYANPVPQGWSDGIPAGEAKLWASTRIFSSDGLAPQQAAWSAPRQMTDTADFDVEYSSQEAPTAPTGHPNTNAAWSNTADETTIWMATSRKSNGVWDAWQISRIKGENGQDGTSIKVHGTFFAKFASRAEYTAAVNAGQTSRGRYYLIDHDEELDKDCVVVYTSLRQLVGVGYRTSYTPAEMGDAYVYNTDGHLYLADSEGWVDVGQFKGDTGAAGANGKNAYVHVKYANSLTTNDWSANNGETPSKYIGVYCDNSPADQLVWSLYQWSKWQGEDGFGYEYIYKRTTANTAPDLPTVSSNTDGYVPSGWNADPLDVSAAYPYCWVAYRIKVSGTWSAWKGSGVTSGKAALWAKFGADGQDGTDGRYTELRFATNGSTTTPPALNKSSLNPTGWSINMPTVSKGYFLWMTRAVKSGNGATLISQWSTPVRLTAADGKNGTNAPSPVVVYRGVYDNSKTYYGNQYRLDAVKHPSNNEWYIARVDAGTFSSPAPPDTSKWNPFGANFESVATNLLLAEGANIGDWCIQNGKIVSTLESQASKIILDAVARRILIESLSPSYSYQMDALQKATIELNAGTGIVEARDPVNYWTAYMSPTGIFANRAGTQCVSATSGCDQRASVVGLGFGKLDKSPWIAGRDNNLIAGVYGNASNTGTAPAYGGYFYNLRANGLILNPKYIFSSNSNTTYLYDTETMVIGCAGERKTVYLPAATREGQTIFVKQWWRGALRFYPRSGQKIYDDTSENEYYDFGEGQGGMFTFMRAAINGENVEVWLVSRWKF